MLDLGGGADFKRKFGAPEKLIPYVRKSRVPGMLALRDLAAHVYKRRATRAKAILTGGAATVASWSETLSAGVETL
jgi:hypothetical protein